MNLVDRKNMAIFSFTEQFAPKMDYKRILKYLQDIAANNNREWYQENKKEYLAVRKDFEENVEELLRKISAFDASIAHLRVKDCTYRFNRDTRFSPDKSPYKRHFGAYMAAHGKKALHGGYYIHLEPGECMIAVGSYWLPTNILTACRNEIMANTEEWLKCVENKNFTRIFGGKEHSAKQTTENGWPNGGKGFGIERLKTCPAGFPKDYEHIEYLRMKDYCAWTKVPDDFFDDENWQEKAIKIFKTGKPMMDFVNNVIDDYE